MIYSFVVLSYLLYCGVCAPAENCTQQAACLVVEETDVNGDGTEYELCLSWNSSNPGCEKDGSEEGPEEGPEEGDTISYACPTKNETDKFEDWEELGENCESCMCETVDCGKEAQFGIKDGKGCHDNLETPETFLIGTCVFDGGYCGGGNKNSCTWTITAPACGSTTTSSSSATTTTDDGGPLDTCEKQQDCLSVTIEDKEDGMKEVCLIWSEEDPCIKDGTISHACPTDEDGDKIEGWGPGDEMCKNVTCGDDAVFGIKNGRTCFGGDLIGITIGDGSDINCTVQDGYCNTAGNGNNGGGKGGGKGGDSNEDCRWTVPTECGGSGSAGSNLKSNDGNMHNNNETLLGTTKQWQSILSLIAIIIVAVLLIGVAILFIYIKKRNAKNAAKQMEVQINALPTASPSGNTADIEDVDIIYIEEIKATE